MTRLLLSDSAISCAPSNSLLALVDIVTLLGSSLAESESECLFPVPPDVEEREPVHGNEASSASPSLSRETRGNADDMIEWSSGGEEENGRKGKEMQKGVKDGKNGKEKRDESAGFLEEESLEEISDFVKSSDSYDDENDDDENEVEEVDDEDGAELTDHFGAMKISNDKAKCQSPATAFESAFPLQVMSKKENEFLFWLQRRESRIAAYSSSSSKMIREVSLAEALSSHDVDHTESKMSDRLGGTLIVTSKALIEVWSDLARRAAGGRSRVEMYTSPINRRRFLRINLKSVDVVITTWDVLKAKEEHGEQSRLHSLTWVNMIVDFGESRTPSERNQGGRAIQFVDARRRLALLEAKLDSCRIGQDPLLTEAFLRQTIRALVHSSNSVPTANIFFDGRR